MRRCVKVVRQHDTIFCKGLEHLQILVSTGRVWSQSLLDSKKQLLFLTCVDDSVACGRVCLLYDSHVELFGVEKS